MSNIIQIKELVYGRFSGVNKTAWIDMLINNGVDKNCTTYNKEYLLIEYSDHRFSNGRRISSERTVYNIDFRTYVDAENEPMEEETEEIVTAHYNSDTDQYTIQYTHYPASEAYTPPDLSDILSEADTPSIAPDVQAPVEAEPVSEQPETVTFNGKTFDRKEVKNAYHQMMANLKPWRKATLNRLKDLFERGLTAKQIMAELKCSKQGMLFQLTFTLGYSHPFEENEKNKWDQSEDEKLLFLYVKTNSDIEEIANILRRSEFSINRRLYQLIGRIYPDMPPEEKTERRISEIRRRDWKRDKKVFQDLVYRDLQKRKERNQKKKEEIQAKLPNGLYRPGAQFHHHLYGQVTVLKDDDRVTILQQTDGKKVRIIK